jgi:polyribonucleotide nucleotidyltransferase
MTARTSRQSGDDRRFRALTMSGLPFMGPIGAARVGYQDGEYILNPSLEQIESGELDLVVAGTHNAVMMVESEAKELSEDVMLGGVMFAHRAIQPVIEAIISLAEQAAKEPWELAEAQDTSRSSSAFATSSAPILPRLQADRQAAAPDRDQRSPRQGPRPAWPTWKPRIPAGYLGALKLVKKLEAEIVRGAILKEGIRIDGRDTKTVRAIDAMVGFLPRTHGSALFTRGETQAIVHHRRSAPRTEQMIGRPQWLSYEQLHAALQLPALLGRRSRTLRRPGAA